LSVQLWDKALQDEPSISNDIANGRFDALLGGCARMCIATAAISAASTRGARHRDAASM
jgi:hypothetical protein